MCVGRPSPGTWHGKPWAGGSRHREGRDLGALSGLQGGAGQEAKRRECFKEVAEIRCVEGCRGDEEDELGKRPLDLPPNGIDSVMGTFPV